MSPVDLNTILLLYHSGWSVERIFRVCLQSINGIKNAPSASGPTPDRVPVYQEFLSVARLLRDLQIKGALEMGQTVPSDSSDTVVEIQLAESEANSVQVNRLRQLLGLDARRSRFRLTTEAGRGTEDRIAIVTRSLMASLFYISQSVEAPPEDERAGHVTVSRAKSGQRFDWKEVTGGLMRIRSARQRPNTAYVAVPYRGSWFFLEDSDLTSKATFSLLTQLFALQAGEIKSAGPILTLPVAR
jgi:hypothetical protein